MRSKFDFFLFWVVLCCVNWTESQYRFDCEPNFCNKKENRCSKSDCKDGRLVKRATRCGCCDICIKSLKEGEVCPTIVFGISGKLEECGPGLVCSKNSKTCVPASTKCIQNQIAFDRHKGEKSLLQQRPDCDEFGYYKPVVCIPGFLCHCVDKEGRRIFGTDLAVNNETMKCDCSLDIEGFTRDVEDGNFPRCLPNGNYDLLQCSDEMCFCMESLTPEDDVINVNASIKKLTCYDDELHRNRMDTKCWHEKANQRAQLKNDSFTAVIGLDLVECDLDGNYSPVQCMKNRCYCVHQNGKPYNGYEVARHSEAAKKMKCDCLRDKEFLKNKGKRMEMMECDNLGNYHTKTIDFF